MKKLITIMLLACMSLPAVATSIEEAQALLTSLGLDVPLMVYGEDIPDGYAAYGRVQQEDTHWQNKLIDGFINKDFLAYDASNQYTDMYFQAGRDTYWAQVTDQSSSLIIISKTRNEISFYTDDNMFEKVTLTRDTDRFVRSNDYFDFEYKVRTDLDESLFAGQTSGEWRKASLESAYDYITQNSRGMVRTDTSVASLFGKDILGALIGEARQLKPAIKNMAYQMAAVQVGKPIRGICDNSVLLSVGTTVGNPACERLWMELEDISKKIRDLNIIEPERYVAHDTSTGLLSTYSVLEDQNSLSATTLELGESLQTTHASSIAAYNGRDYYWGPSTGWQFTSVEGYQLGNQWGHANAHTVRGDSSGNYQAGEYTWSSSFNEWRSTTPEGNVVVIKGNVIREDGSKGDLHNFSSANVTYTAGIEYREGDLLFVDENGNSRYSSDLVDDESVIYYAETVINPGEDYNTSIERIQGIATGYSGIAKVDTTPAVMGFMTGRWKTNSFSITEISEGNWLNDDASGRTYTDEDIAGFADGSNPDFNSIDIDWGTEELNSFLTIGDLFTDLE